MNRNRLDGAKGTIRALEGILEVAVLTIVYYILWRKGYDRGVFPNYFGNGKYVLAGVYALLVVVLFNNFEGFRFGYLRLSEVIISQWIAVVIANFITFWQLCLIANVVISPVPILMLTVLDGVIVFVCCYIYVFLYHKLYAPKNMVMVYGSENAVYLKFKMDTRKDKYHVTKLISATEGYEAICAQLKEYDAVILSDVEVQIRNDIMKFCYENRIRTYVAPEISDIMVRGATEICLFDTPLMLVRGRGLTVTQKVIKRFVDILLSLLAMIIASPVMLLVALAIKIEDGGPVFYRQDRVTLNGKVFSILKFRSMIVDAEKNGKSQPATGRDPRITKVGNLIRATRIDELPQIINILKGDMSIVGPRPERVEHVEQYTRDLPEFAYRLKVKGGLTGYAQIYGKYNTSAYDKLRLDLMYIENYSILLDIKLILLTLRIILKKESTEGFEMQAELERKKMEMLGTAGHSEGDRK
jgi:exopolysaccharide biosynthesis polyprenyl glycosylphosphotransferase